MMDSGEEVYESREEPAPLRSRQAQNSRAFFPFLGSVLAIILLGIFLNLQLDGFTRVLILLGLVGLVGLGIVLLERHEKHDDAEQEPFVGSDEGSGETDALAPEDEFDETTQPTPDSFEQLVQDALNSIPEEFHERMENLVVIVEDEPDSATLTSVGIVEGCTLLGLYHGVPLTALGHTRALLPERITIYQHPIERYCGGDPTRIRDQVRATLLHEVAHHFGMDHDDMPIWIK